MQDDHSGEHFRDSATFTNASYLYYVVTLEAHSQTRITLLHRSDVRFAAYYKINHLRNYERRLGYVH